MLVHVGEPFFSSPSMTMLVWITAASVFSRVLLHKRQFAESRPGMSVHVGGQPLEITML